MQGGIIWSAAPDGTGVWRLTFPPGHPSGPTEVGFLERDLQTGLLRVLRDEEQRSGVLYRYQQGDERWGRIVYAGTNPLVPWTTIGQAGCGPTSLAIVLQYLMNVRAENSSTAVAPPETASYAATHGRGFTRNERTGRLEAAGTAGDPMIRGIRRRWPGFEGSKVNLNEATGLLREGKLIIFLCHGCRGYRNLPGRRPPEVRYAGHYMVLARVEGTPGPDQPFYVVDPARGNMHYIHRSELRQHAAGFWWVYHQGEPEARVCQ